MIYLIRAGENGPVKIGCSSNPYKRMANLQTSHWEKLYLLRTLDAPDSVERMLHDELSQYNIRGEWYEPSVLNEGGYLDRILNFEVNYDISMLKDFFQMGFSSGIHARNGEDFLIFDECWEERLEHYKMNNKKPNIIERIQIARKTNKRSG